MTEFLSHSELETADIARRICSVLHGGQVVAFTGGMGMGKTAFVRGALTSFGNTSFVSSPTFALVHDYGGSPHIYHFDMYRVMGADDLYSTGFYDYMNEDSILFIEWSENIADEIPDDAVRIDISRGADEDERVIRVEGGGF